MSAKQSTEKTGGRRDLAATKKRILQAAAGEFAQEGFQGARIDRIARKSRANKAMIYYIFGNKEALHFAVLENLFEEKTRDLDVAFSDAPLSPESLFPLLSSYLDAFLQNPDATRVIFHDIAANASALRKLSNKRPELIEPFRDIGMQLKRLMDGGKLRATDPDKVVLVAMFVLMALPVFLPHTDLLYPKGTHEHENLTSPDSWKSFLAELLLRSVAPSALNP